MNNAFTVLGAEPTDSTERLQELLDEKELLLDDASEAQAAYADLTNPKKRIQHEIEYFCSDALDDFNKLVNRSFEETPTLSKIANIVVKLGWWFDEDDNGLLERINDARLSQADEVAFVFFEAILFIGLLMLLVAIAVRAYAFRRYGTEEQNLSARYNLKLFSYCCVSVIPCLIISVLLIVSSEINIFVPIEFLLSYLILASYILFAVAAIVYRVKHKKIIVTL